MHEFCHDSESHPKGFWIHDNLVVNNDRAGIRFERVGEVADAGEALIENNKVHGNSLRLSRGGIDIRDAQNALVRNNVFGGRPSPVLPTHATATAWRMRATDSGRSDRPDLLNGHRGQRPERRAHKGLREARYDSSLLRQPVEGFMEPVNGRDSAAGGLSRES